MNTILALAGVVLKELYRRKDFYVLFVITAVLSLVMGSVRFFDDPRIVRYLKEICLLLVWVSALVIAVTTAARQIPSERENRTIFPLLAKPVTRAQVVAGKFLGCWFATGAALFIFYLFFAILSGTHEHRWPVSGYLQAFWLQWMMLAVVIALALLGSIIFSAPSANATICFIVVLAIFMLGDHLNQMALRQKEPLSTIVFAVYVLLPHLEWFDVRAFLIYDWPIIPWVYVLLAAVYAAVYTLLFLFATWLVFRRKPLTA